MGEDESDDGEEKSARSAVEKLVAWKAEHVAFGLTCWLQMRSKL